MTFKLIPTSFLRFIRYPFEILFANMPILLYYVYTSTILTHSSKKQNGNKAILNLLQIGFQLPEI